MLFKVLFFPPKSKDLGFAFSLKLGAFESTLFPPKSKAIGFAFSLKLGVF